MSLRELAIQTYDSVSNLKEIVLIKKFEITARARRK